MRTLSDYLRPLPGRKHIVFYSGGYPLTPTETYLDILRRRISAARADDLNSEQMAIINTSLQMVQRRQFSNLMQSAIDYLNRSQISVYSVDARGLMSYEIPPKRRHSLLQRNGKQLQYSAADVFQPQDFLVSIATSTGGLPFLNNNDLNRGLRTAYRDASEYYLLAYTPSSKRKSGKFDL